MDVFGNVSLPCFSRFAAKPQGTHPLFFFFSVTIFSAMTKAEHSINCFDNEVSEEWFLQSAFCSFLAIFVVILIKNCDQ
jgi:hypothetical protein